jgi:hypothetical protein
LRGTHVVPRSILASLFESFPLDSRQQQIMYVIVLPDTRSTRWLAFLALFACLLSLSLLLSLRIRSSRAFALRPEGPRRQTEPGPPSRHVRLTGRTFLPHFSSSLSLSLLNSLTRATLPRHNGLSVIGGLGVCASTFYMCHFGCLKKSHL